MTTEAIRMLKKLSETAPGPFALLHRPESNGPGQVDLLRGEVVEVLGTQDIPQPESESPGRHEMLVVLPYRLIAERGYDCHDDGEPVLAMTISEQVVTSVDQIVGQALRWPVTVRAGEFDISDEEYARIVHQVITEEIGQGSGANFVIKRSFIAEITNWSPRTALAFYARLLRAELGAYWTFLVHTGKRTFIGASPERHTSLDRGTVVMNPISGTYRYPATGPTVRGVLNFLADDKETNELYMVLDEELKMMSRLCDRGARVVGPYLKEMAHLAHTEYLIKGDTSRDFLSILRETMFAPTVTGSPLESAGRVIARFEPEGRGYYGGAVVLLGRDGDGQRRLDSAILIRTADIDREGNMRVGVGSTLVRNSDPAAEAAETRAKASGLLGALRDGPEFRATGVTPSFNSHPDVREALAARNAPLAQFWLAAPEHRVDHRPELAGRKVLIIDAEDTFTAMGQQILQTLGLDVCVRRFDEPYHLDGHDLIVIGPGPGNPCEHDHPKIAYLRQVTRRVLELGTPLLSVCLGHQVLSSLLGLDIVRKTTPYQGVQREIDLFGRRELVYFYNSFAACSRADILESDAHPGRIMVWRDSATNEVHAMRGQGFASVQFHPASVMTQNGAAILGELITTLLHPSRAVWPNLTIREAVA